MQSTLNGGIRVNQCSMLVDQRRTAWVGRVSKVASDRVYQGESSRNRERMTMQRGSAD